MSEENVEIVRKALEHWNRGDLDAFLERVLDEHTVLRAAEGWPERVYYGKDAVRSYWEGMAEATGHDSVIEHLTDVGDRVVLRARSHWTGEHSGLQGDLEFSQVMTFRKGKIVMTEFFWDHQEVLEAAGLQE